MIESNWSSDGKPPRPIRRQRQPAAAEADIPPLNRASGHGANAPQKPKAQLEALKPDMKAEPSL